jgi:hypothetical protein
MERKIILNVKVADALIRRGFPVQSVKPSNKLKGRTAFVFDATPEFSEALTEISNQTK